MKNLNYFLIVGLLIVSVSCLRSRETKSIDELKESIPEFREDPFWPKLLPDKWLIGQVAGVAVDSKDHIWIIHRPNSLGADEARPEIPVDKLPYTPAPSVIEFDTAGNMVRAWGGPGEGYQWPVTEHGIYIDYQDNVWIGAANTTSGHYVLKFRRDGTFLLQIGKTGKSGGSNDTVLLGRPTDFDVDQEANEVYIADGYLNHRIIVFDAVTGKYKRHWGAYGNKPEDSPQEPYNSNETPPAQFGVVHAVRISFDGLVYVCDRSNNRIQVFHKDGRFIQEAYIAKNTIGLGSTWDIDFSQDPRQTLLYVPDGTNQCVWILRRKNLEVVGQFGRIGRYPGQFIWVHNVAVDSRGNIYTAEVKTGKRVQKFILQSVFSNE